MAADNDHDTEARLEERYPLVTIGIPTYNGSKSIAGAVKSVIDQHYPNVEIVISDNCSCDSTQEMGEWLGSNYPEVKYYRQETNIGLTNNFLFVQRKASGKYFMWLADDDWLEPGILRKYVSFLERNSGHSLVSGQIQYWLGNRCLLIERDFNIEHQSPYSRMLYFYFRVVYGSIYHGLMRNEHGTKVPLRNRIGDDWHFVAGLTYLGKVKNLNCIGYNKRLAGTSSNFENYAKVLGASSFIAKFPHLNVGFDAFAEVFKSPLYRNVNPFVKIPLAAACFLAVCTSFYGKTYPFIIGGKLKRLFMKSLSFVPRIY
jgi:glycosyltransferase involved in cell wall biosynthesis